MGSNDLGPNTNPHILVAGEPTISLAKIVNYVTVRGYSLFKIHDAEKILASKYYNLIIISVEDLT